MVARQRYRQTVDQAEWYHQDWPEWRRSLGWALRNPLQNFRAFVIGVQDRNYEVEVVHESPDPEVVQRNDVGEYGYQVIKLKFKYGVQLPFVSYSGKRVVWYSGWQPSGFFGLKFNLHSEGEFDVLGQYGIVASRCGWPPYGTLIGFEPLA